MTMVSGSWPKSETLSQCFTLVRWFHEYGVAWSGTPAELAFTLSAAGEGASWYRNSDELARFIETNADMLRDLGLETTIRQEAGRTTIDFQSNNHGQAVSSTGQSEPSAQLAAIEARIAESKSVETFVPGPPVVPQRPSIDLGARLHNLIDEDSEKVTAYEPVNVNIPPAPEVTKAPEPNPLPAARKGKPAVAVIFAGILLVLATLTFVRSRPRTAASQQPTISPSQPPIEKVEKPPIEKAEKVETPVPTPTAPVAVVVPPTPPVATPAAATNNLDPVERKNFDAVFAVATINKFAPPQYELGMRYAQGAGIPKDNAQAFTWLTLAEVNGSAEATSALQVIQPALSHDELQRARIAIANAFNSGIAVSKNEVQAYRWLTKAERDGSSEAAVLKKGLEVRMYAWQIIQAGGTPPVVKKKE